MTQYGVVKYFIAREDHKTTQGSHFHAFVQCREKPRVMLSVLHLRRVRPNHKAGFL